ncbi:MAG: DNA gyrase inhibitor YacG [Gammaproteobacteria bacterium]|nr:DNA gyrase inhibitor YacG [Gammaproteobacteria bacterium]
MKPELPSLNVKCPTCSTEIVWNEKNVFRPFCCERCRLIDLGDWIAEKHVIPGMPENSIAKESEEE